MEPWNTTFTLFILDSRPFEDIRTSLDEMLGGRFEQDLKYKADGVFRYTNYVFGISISCMLEEKWPEGQVYRLGGFNDNCCVFSTDESHDMSFHVHKLLSIVPFERVMTFDEFRNDSARRQD